MEMEVLSITTFIAILISFIFLYTLFSLLKPLNNVKLPPGPAQFPIIGSLHKLGNLPHRTLAGLAKIYGPIMSLKLGSTTAVVVSSPATAKEILQKQDIVFSTRSISDAIHAQHHYKYSVVWLPVSNRWRSLRKILNTHMFYVNRLDANQHIIARKVNELIEYCRKRSKSGDPVNIGKVGFATSLNVLSNLMFSTDLTDLNQSSTDFRDLVSNIMVEGGKTNIVDFFPWLARFDPQGRRRRMDAHFQRIFKIFDELICRRLETRKLEKNVVNCDDADVLDVCLNIAQENPDEIDQIHMEHMFLDLFVAGTDTTSNVLEWAMSELLRNPEKMAKVKLELKQVIGEGQPLKDSNIPNLPYLNCVIKETLRVHSAFLIPRSVEKDVDVFGYIIPKGSLILVNVHAIGRDPTIWEDPSSFNPERFLDSNVDVRGQDFEFIPFGSGRRICPGIPLAMKMEPLMLGSLLNCFDWKLEGGIKPENLDMDDKLGITLQKALPLIAIPTPI